MSSALPQPAGVDALAQWDDNRNGRITCAEARRHGIVPVPRGHPVPLARRPWPPTESQVAVWIAAGQTVREIAAALGRTPGAVQWSLRHISHKPGLRGHADLIQNQQNFVLTERE